MSTVTKLSVIFFAAAFVVAGTLHAGPAARSQRTRVQLLARITMLKSEISALQFQIGVLQGKLALALKGHAVGAAVGPPSSPARLTTMEDASRALKHMVKKRDVIGGITWYTDKSSPRYVNDRTAFYAYFGKFKDGTVILRMEIQYVGSDWLFIHKYTIRVDGKNYNFRPAEFGNDAVKRDSGTTGDGEVGVWEWWDIAATPRMRKVMALVATSKKAVIRLQGKQYYKDYTITKEEKRAIRHVLAACKAKGG